MTQETLEQQLQREAREMFMELDDFGAEKLDTIIATTIQRVRESERDKHVWLGFQQSGEGYNYEYWGQRPIEELKDEVIKKALSLLDLLKDNPE